MASNLNAKLPQQQQSGPGPVEAFDVKPNSKAEHDATQ